MKKLLLSAAALCCFVSAHAQWTTSGTNIYNANTGNVGIGTGATAPAGRLDVAGSFFTNTGTVNIRPQNTTAEGGEINLFGSGTNATWTIDNLSGRLRFYTGTTERVNLFSDGTLGISGNVGVGTYTPGYKLDVVGRSRFQAGNGTAGFWLNNLGNTAVRSFFGMVDDNFVGMWGQPLGNWGLVMNVNSGSVGIGTTATGIFRLAVEGKIGANEVQVRTPGSSWADYVFYDTYKLRPLAEVEKYVKQNHHLPEVPSAAQVEKDGHNLGQMDAILLKKIEELTLYMIEQNKKLEAYSQQVEALQKELVATKK